MEEARNILYNDLNNKKGIYLLYNTINHLFYIGSSINLYKRLNTYYYPSRLLDNRHISRSINKVGHSNFSIYILEIYEKDNPIDIIEMEQYYINMYNPELNILKNAGNSLGYKHTDAIKKVLAEYAKKQEILSRN